MIARQSLVWCGVVVLGCGAGACGRPPQPTAEPTPAPAACALSGDSAFVPDTLTFGVPGGFDPGHAPVPTSDLERFVFRQVYETLIRVDCRGDAVPALATSWLSSDSGHRWTFTLRADARFEDGLPLTARDVVASWTERDSALPPLTELTAVGERVVSVRLSKPAAALPLLFADPALAPTRSVDGRRWPQGAGEYRVDTSAGRVIVAPVAGARRPALVLRGAGTADPRDLVDAGVDVIVTGDAAVLSYVARRGDRSTTALPWDRTFLLVAPAGAVGISDSMRAGLARDAVRVEARAASGSFWWSDLAACAIEQPVANLPATTGVPSLVYPRDDMSARDLAERLVAIGTGSGTVPIKAIGLPASEFAVQLASGRSGQFVMPVSRATLDPCREARGLMARAPWIMEFGARIVALVDTRRRAVVRRGAAALTVDWDGTLRVR